MFLILITLFNIHASSCTDKLIATETTCSVYRCMEREMKCGKRGYPLNFGRKYCHQFNAKKSLFSNDGKRFLLRNRKCLQEKFLERRDQTCREIKWGSLRDHMYCYEMSGFCELSKADKKAVVKVVGLKALRNPIFNFLGALRLKKLCK